MRVNSAHVAKTVAKNDGCSKTGSVGEARSQFHYITLVTKAENTLKSPGKAKVSDGTLPEAE